MTLDCSIKTFCAQASDPTTTMLSNTKQHLSKHIFTYTSVTIAPIWHYFCWAHGNWGHVQYVLMHRQTNVKINNAPCCVEYRTTTYLFLLCLIQYTLNSICNTVHTQAEIWAAEPSRLSGKRNHSSLLSSQVLRWCHVCTLFFDISYCMQFSDTVSMSSFLTLHPHIIHFVEWMEKTQLCNYTCGTTDTQWHVCCLQQL